MFVVHVEYCQQSHQYGWKRPIGGMTLLRNFGLCKSHMIYDRLKCYNTWISCCSGGAEWSNPLEESSGMNSSALEYPIASIADVDLRNSPGVRYSVKLFTGSISKSWHDLRRTLLVPAMWSLRGSDFRGLGTKTDNIRALWQGLSASHSTFQSLPEREPKLLRIDRCWQGKKETQI